MRDFKLIDQSDMIVSLVPELPVAFQAFPWSRTRTAACLGAHQGGVCGVEAGQEPKPLYYRDSNPNLCFGG